MILDNRQQAIYFSRHPIPFIRGTDENQWLAKHTFYKHIGIYGYRSDILEQITLLPPSDLELAESLEQLRWLQNGFRISTALTSLESQGIDSPDDLNKILNQPEA